jgi:phage replication-related protein YjqB (UPF0714/DUF867 family)
MSRYRNFAELSQSEKEGRDYAIVHREGSSGNLVMAPHGGGIEPGTDDLAEAIAGQRHALYCFQGIKPGGNRTLHLASACFDEPRAAAMLSVASWALTLHGCRGDEPVVWVGGRDRQGGGQIIERLCGSGIPAFFCDRPGLRGRHPHNLCNRARSRAGVQLEFSAGLRRRLFAGRTNRCQSNPTPLFHRLVHALTACLGDKGIPAENRPVRTSPRS